MALVVLVNINVFIGGGIVHCFRSWSTFKKTHNSAIKTSLRALRDESILSMTVALMEYIDDERKSDPRARLADLLSYGYSDQQLRVIEPKLTARERIGEHRRDLQRLSRSAMNLAAIAIAALALSFIFVFPVFLPLGLRISNLCAAWYATMTSIMGITACIGVLSMIAMHISETRFSTRLADLESGESDSEG